MMKMLDGGEIGGGGLKKEEVQMETKPGAKRGEEGTNN
jgi:hypothetical protein